jgi:hypothetical protein
MTLESQTISPMISAVNRRRPFLILSLAVAVAVGLALALSIRPSRGSATTKQLDSITVKDPVDLQVASDGTIYVLSKTPAAVTQFSPAGAVVRAFTGLGNAPQGLCIDRFGNVFVALTGNHQVLKLRPVAGSFEPDTTFNATGRLGRSDGTPGMASGEFNSPCDVAIIYEGDLYVSDGNNHRIQKFDASGRWLTSIGGPGSAFGQFRNPKGLTFDSQGNLVIADSANSRLVFIQSDEVSRVFGQAGSGIGSFTGVANVAASQYGICTTEPSINRIQKFISGANSDSDLQNLTAVWHLASQFGISRPEAVTFHSSLVGEIIYIADRPNNRIVPVEFLKTLPTPVWDKVKSRLLAGDIEGALPYFASSERQAFREEFTTLGAADLKEMMTAAGPLTPVFVTDTLAKYRFVRTHQGREFGFAVIFRKEKGEWKIVSF